MDLIAHLVFGFWVYRNFGIIWALPLSCILDIDHLIGYLYDKRRKTHWYLPDFVHLAYRPRTWLHSIGFVTLIAIPLMFVLPWYVVVISLYGHLFLDGLDRFGVYIFPPFISKRIHGALPVGYLLEDQNYLSHHKRSHFPSFIFIIALTLLMLMRR